MALTWLSPIGFVHARPTETWLIVGASDRTPDGIARKVKDLARKHRGSFVFATRDCGDKSNVFGWAVESAPSREAAQEALARVRGELGSAYVKHCQVAPQSLLANHFSAVDPSIADVPADAEAWTDDDRSSSAVPLPDGRTLVIARFFEADPEDPLEGKRERVLLFGPSGESKTVMDSCVDAGAVSARADRVAFHCVREQAADQDLHSSFVFTLQGTQVAEVEHCRSPKWIKDTELQCVAESIGDDGLLILRPKRAQLP